MNIVQRLLLLVVLTVLPLSVLQVVRVNQQRQEESGDIPRLVLRTAFRVGAEQRRVVEGARQLLTALSQLPAVRDGDAERCGVIMQRLQSEFQVYTAIGVSSPQGRIWCSNTRPGTDVSDRDYFRQVVSSRKFTIGGYVVGRAGRPSGRRTLNFSLPIVDAAGRLGGVLIAGLDLDRLAADVARAPLPPGSSLLIVGPDRRILVDQPHGRHVGMPLPPQFAAAFEARQPGGLRAKWLDGADRVIGFVPPAADPQMPFMIAVGIDQDRALKAVDARALQAVIVSFLVLAAALLIAWWVAARFVRRPLQLLADTAHAWRRGDRTVRVGPLDAGSEFDALGRAFDAMAEATEERERRLSDALESTTDSAWSIAPDWRLTFLNRRARSRLGRGDLLGQNLWDVFPETVGGPAWIALQEAMRDRRSLAVTLEFEPLGGHFEVNAFPARDGGLILFIREITEQYRAQQELRHLALNDPLTNLPNRPHAMEIARLRAAEGRLSAVILLDLDGFKHVNDRFGHAEGDAVLREAAQRLSSCLGDGGVIARLGGDEFIALLLDAADPQEVGPDLVSSLERAPFLVRGHLHQLSCSCGVVVVDRSGGGDIKGLLADADLALYRAKAAGGGTCCTFSGADRDAYEARHLLEEEIARAVTRSEFELYYQPQLRMDDGSLVGAEALLRWRHPTRGLLSPDAFIDVLEHSRHARATGNWIIEQACRQAALWSRRGFPLRIGVNLFSGQLRSGELAEIVQCALMQYHLPADRLELELTENIALAGDDGIKDTLEALRRLGVRLAFDDFGTGFASLTTLKHFRVDRLKIDRGFVQHLPDNPQDKGIVEAVLALARTLDLEVIAEGVETEEQERYLRSRGCHEAQGYRYSRPMAASEFRLFLAASQRRRQAG